MIVHMIPGPLPTGSSREAGDIRCMQVTAADSKVTASVERLWLLRGGLRRVCSSLLAMLLAGNICAFAGGERASVRLPPRKASSVGSGVASWYGHPYHGRRAANGRIYDMYKLTAAHRTLPLGTRLRVHSLENARAVEVSITDRGPFVGERLIDVSLAAADILGMTHDGVARVWLEVLSIPIRPMISGGPSVKIAFSRTFAD